MSFQSVLVVLNELKKEGVIKDYAIAGGYAVMYYDIPISTFDLDILVVLSSEDDFHRLYEYYRQKGAKIENVYIYINNMPVQFLPNYISPLFNSAIEEADVIDFDDISSKVVSVEFLVVLLLTSFRSKDKIRIQSLLNKADSALLLEVIRRFDNEEHQLYERYQKILAGTSES